jgi:hypothetical protein
MDSTHTDEDDDGKYVDFKKAYTVTAFHAADDLKVGTAIATSLPELVNLLLNTGISYESGDLNTAEDVFKQNANVILIVAPRYTHVDFEIINVDSERNYESTEDGVMDTLNLQVKMLSQDDKDAMDENAGDEVDKDGYNRRWYHYQISRSDNGAEDEHHCVIMLALPKNIIDARVSIVPPDVDSDSVGDESLLDPFDSNFYFQPATLPEPQLWRLVAYANALN